MKSIKVVTINVGDKVEAWASTKKAVIEVAEAAAKALAKAYQMIVDRCGQHVDYTIEVKKGSVACDICKGYARLTTGNPNIGLAITPDTAHEHWRGEIKEWQALAKALAEYTSVEHCYRILVERL